MVPQVCVIMPTYGQEAFISRALKSLSGQSLSDWELQIVDDGSPDATARSVLPFLADPRIRYHRLPENRGMGAALNFGLAQTAAPWIAYLPSDDVYYRDHLGSLAAALRANPAAALAYSGVRHHYNRVATGAIELAPLQLVQVMHRRGGERWIEREVLVTDDLDRMFWRQLGPAESRVGTGQVTCEWVDHPQQRHKLLQEPVGGINLYRQRFQVPYPLRFHTTTGNLIDEVAQYRHQRERPDTPRAPDGLKILLVGELAYNADRILALEERGHKLYGLWMRDPYWYNTVGPLPFGHVEDVPFHRWRQAVQRLRPDVIYALLNWQAVPLAHEVLKADLRIPLVWHFKEGPFICREKGTWRELVELYSRSDGQIYSSPEMRDWFEGHVLAAPSRESMVLDGDLPKADWFGDVRPARLPAAEGEFHTVVPGRPIGLHPETVAELGQQGIHIHFYGDFTHGQWRTWIEKARRLAPRHLHLHAQVDQARWVCEFGQYDAGWLHFFPSENGGDLQRANWDDLNYPARISTLVAAGLPLLQRDNAGSVVATQTLARRLNLGIFFQSMEQLRVQLADTRRMDEIRANVWNHRAEFTFDHHADRLIQFFRQTIQDYHPARHRRMRALRPMVLSGT